jgi:hypothetical protein
MKIVYALNSKNHISYRDSRLTHQLHDFLSWESTSVVIACLVSSFQVLLFSDFFLELWKGQTVEKYHGMLPTKYREYIMTSPFYRVHKETLLLGIIKELEG